MTVSERPKPPQLRMRFNRFDSLPEVSLPEGYAMSTLDGMDEDDWMESLNATGELGEWDRERVREWLDGERHAVREGTFIITFEGRPVGTTCTVPPTSTEPRSELGWVSVSPAHQGQGLGYQVCIAVLHYAREMGYSETYLNTDDWRLPAIKTYLNLGFEPEMIDESHLERWATVLAELDEGDEEGG